MTTARDTAEALAERFHSTYERLAPSFGYQTRAESAVAWADVPHKELMIATCAELLAGFVVVACPHGGRVVVSRESKPCPECDGIANRWRIPCAACGGSGVVEATTIHGLEAFGYRCVRDGCPGGCDGVHFEGAQRLPAMVEVESWELVALPEETPQVEAPMPAWLKHQIAGSSFVPFDPPAAVALPEEGE